MDPIPPQDNDQEEQKIEDKKDDSDEADMVEDKDDEEDRANQGEKTIKELKEEFFEVSKNPIHDPSLFEGHWEENKEEEQNEELEKYMFEAKEYRLYRKQDLNDETKQLIYKRLRDGKLPRIF